MIGAAKRASGLRGGGSAAGAFEDQVAQARKAVLRQLLAWERDFVSEPEPGAAAAPPDDAPAVKNGCSRQFPWCALERLPVHVHPMRTIP